MKNQLFKLPKAKTEKLIVLPRLSENTRKLICVMRTEPQSVELGCVSTSPLALSDNKFRLTTAASTLVQDYLADPVLNVFLLHFSSY